MRTFQYIRFAVLLSILVSLPPCLRPIFGQDSPGISASLAKSTADNTNALSGIEPLALRNRRWSWEKGTAFGDNAHSISILDKNCTLGPDLNAYSIKEGTKLDSNVKLGFLTQKTFHISVRSKSEFVHNLPQDGSPGKEVCAVTMDFHGMTIRFSGGRLEMQGTCSYEILWYYQRNGREKPHLKKKEDGVHVLLTAPWTPAPLTMPNPSEADLAETELDSRRKECADLLASQEANRNNGTAPESNANVLGTASATVRGKKFELEFREWNSTGGMYDGRSGKAIVYVPRIDGFWPNMGFPGSLANEVGHFIMDASDGFINGLSADIDGSPISHIDTEIKSDMFSRDMLRYILEQGTHPFKDYGFVAPSSLRHADLLYSSIIRNEFTSSIWNYLPAFIKNSDIHNLTNPDSLASNLRRYENRIATLEKAKNLVDEGRISEAFDFLKEKQFPDYACKLLDYADSLKAKGPESGDQPSAK